MGNFRYKLDPSPKKYICPSCQKKCFVRYVDSTTGELLPERYGRCDRERKCGYHLNPYEDKYGIERKEWQPLPPPPPQPTSYIPDEIFRNSLRGYKANNFVQWLTRLVGIDAAEAAVNRFQLGTSSHWPGACVFWQIHPSGSIHGGKILLYNPDTGKRVKDETGAKIQWAHRELKIDDYNLNQCYFGLHQLNNEPEKPIALCEAEKTACVASVYLPQFTWMATGGLQMLSTERFKPLAGRQVVLFPDGDGYEIWARKALELKRKYPSTRITVSDLIETHCTPQELSNGIDFCDLLIRLNPSVSELIRQQWERLNPSHWIINPEKLPGITKYNLSVLTEDLNNKNSLNITPAEYYYFCKQQELTKVLL